MDLTITFHVNRIYFESYEAPCGEPERSEIRQAWESAIVGTIEAAGYTCEFEHGVGFDPGIKWYARLGEGESYAWNGGGVKAKDGYPLDDACEECEDAAAKDLWHEVLPILRRDTERTVEAALEAAGVAASELSDQFVRESQEAADDNP